MSKDLINMEVMISRTGMISILSMINTTNIKNTKHMTSTKNMIGTINMGSTINILSKKIIKEVIHTITLIAGIRKKIIILIGIIINQGIMGTESILDHIEMRGAIQLQ